MVIPIWKGEGGSGRWNGPWIYNLKSDEWRELVDIRRREVILDTAIGGNDLWFATDRKLYRFNIALNQHPKIYAFSEDRKRLIHINKEIIAVALKGSKNQRRWGIFWLSEEPVLSLKGELLRLLNEDDKEIQKLALRGVGRAKIIEALPILSDMKKDIDLASFVVFALYSIRSDKVKGLLESFCLEEIEGYCSKSIEALSCMDNGTSSFKRLLKIKSPYNLASIVYYLSKAQDEETVLLLLNLAEKVSAARKAQGKFYNYSRGNPWYRLNQTLIESFGEIRDKRAVMWLKKEYEDNKDIETKLMILDSIAAILRTEAIPYLEKVATSEANAQILDRVDKILLMLGGR